MLLQLFLGCGLALVVSAQPSFDVQVSTFFDTRWYIIASNEDLLPTGARCSFIDYHFDGCNKDKPVKAILNSVTTSTQEKMWVVTPTLDRGALVSFSEHFWLLGTPVYQIVHLEGPLNNPNLVVLALVDKRITNTIRVIVRDPEMATQRVLQEVYKQLSGKIPELGTRAPPLIYQNATLCPYSSRQAASRKPSNDDECSMNLLLSCEPHIWCKKFGMFSCVVDRNPTCDRRKYELFQAENKRRVFLEIGVGLLAGAALVVLGVLGWRQIKKSRKSPKINSEVYVHAPAKPVLDMFEQSRRRTRSTSTTHAQG